MHLAIITQEKIAFDGPIEALVAPASEGEVTILPHHIPLVTKLNPGEIRIFKDHRWQSLVTAGGFMDVSADGHISLLADSAIRVDEINIAKAEEAKRKAEERLREDLTDQDYAAASADLRRVIAELKVARKHRLRSASLPRE